MRGRTKGDLHLDERGFIFYGKVQKPRLKGGGQDQLWEKGGNSRGAKKKKRGEEKEQVYGKGVYKVVGERNGNKGG